MHTKHTIANTLTHTWLASLKSIQLREIWDVNVSHEEWGTFILRTAEDSTFPPPSLLIITEIAGMHDPENKAWSWESPPEASSASSLGLHCVSPQSDATHTRLERGRGSAPITEEHSPGTLHCAPTSQIPEAEREKKKIKMGSDWKHCPLWALSHALTTTKNNMYSWESEGWFQSWWARRESAALQLYYHPKLLSN